jgi:hypothetical protein
LGVRCFTIRDMTESSITVERGTNVVLGTNPDGIRAIFRLLETKSAVNVIPLWGGEAGGRAAAVLAVSGSEQQPRSDPRHTGRLEADAREASSSARGAAARAL